MTNVCRIKPKGPVDAIQRAVIFEPDPPSSQGEVAY